LWPLFMLRELLVVVVVHREGVVATARTCMLFPC
jgi:hypothetical protein